MYIVVLYELRKKQLKYLGVVQNIAGNCVFVQFLNCSGEKTFSVRDGDFDDCSCYHIKAVIKERQFYEYSWAVFNWRKAFTKELIYVTVLYVVSYILFKNCFLSKCVLYRNKLFFHFKAMDLFLYDINFYKQNVHIFDYSWQAFSTLKLNERHNNLFLFVLSSGNLLSI